MKGADPDMRRLTKRMAAQMLYVIAAEIRLTLDESDEDCPSWADDLTLIGEALEGLV